MTDIRFQPTGARVLVRRKPDQETTKNGIILSANAQNEINFGTVIAVGPGFEKLDGTFYKPPLEVGKVVGFSKHAGVRWMLDGVPVALLEETEVLGVKL